MNVEGKVWMYHHGNPVSSVLDRYCLLSETARNVHSYLFFVATLFPVVQEAAVVLWSWRLRPPDRFLRGLTSGVGARFDRLDRSTGQ